GDALSLPIGKIEENFAWDVQIIDTLIPSAKLPLFNERLDEVFEKIMYLSRPENIREVWVQGNLVHKRN
ncbi:guanine deaminase, partial [Butyricicoccus sp. 1XD8-22]